MSVCVCPCVWCSCRAVGGLPGVTVSPAANAKTASIFADKLCAGVGASNNNNHHRHHHTIETVPDTSLILYLNRGSVLSRPFTAKDTHSPRGDLLVVYGSARASRRDSELAKHTAAIIGAAEGAVDGGVAPPPLPSFTYGTDLVLPVGANADLREMIFSSNDDDAAEVFVRTLAGLDDLSAVPQVCVCVFGRVVIVVAVVVVVNETRIIRSPPNV